MNNETRTKEIMLRRMAYQVIRGLDQEVHLKPGIPGRHDRRTFHYVPEMEAGARVLTLVLRYLNPTWQEKIRSSTRTLSTWAGHEDDVIRLTMRGAVGKGASTPVLEIPTPEELWEPVTVEALEQRHAFRLGHSRAALGFTTANDVAVVDFERPDVAHLLLCGQTRSGKTTTGKMLAVSLARTTKPPTDTEPGEANYILIDTTKKGLHWKDFNRLAHLAHPVVTEIEEAERVLAWLVQEIEERALADSSLYQKRYFLMVDEVKALIEDSQVAGQYLARIAAVGGEFGLHLVLATQYPQIKMLGSAELKRNITTRLCGRVDAADAAANALGVRNSGAHQLTGYGDFLLRDPGSSYLKRLTVAQPTGTHIEALPVRPEPLMLALPDRNWTDSGIQAERLLSPSAFGPQTHPGQSPDPMEPEHVALALWNEGASGLMGQKKLVTQLGIGTGKAQRIQEFALRLVAYARKLEATIDVNDPAYDARIKALLEGD